MKRISLTLVSVLFLGLGLAAGTRDRLKFNGDGTFRIIQFTDVHLDSRHEERTGEATKSLNRISGAIMAEKPDFVVFTGDVVTDGVALVMWNRLMDTLNRHQVPFAIVFGNHDPEQELSRAEMSGIITDSPNCFNVLNKAGELADIEIPVMASDGKSVAAAFYCMDSHDYSKINGIGGYGWFSREQVDWLYDSCMKMTRKEGKAVPSLAFFHIPLPEYVDAWATRNLRENSFTGRKCETECPAKINSGMFASMVESGSVMGTFCGHDHDNDYVVENHGIALCYGRFSGDNTTYNNLRHGYRVIVLKEGKREFESWIHEDDGRIVDHMEFRDGKVFDK